VFGVWTRNDTQKNDRGALCRMHYFQPWRTCFLDFSAPASPCYPDFPRALPPQLPASPALSWPLPACANLPPGHYRIPDLLCAGALPGGPTTATQIACAWVKARRAAVRRGPQHARPPAVTNGYSSCLPAGSAGGRCAPFRAAGASHRCARIADTGFRQAAHCPRRPAARQPQPPGGDAGRHAGNGQ
jgi:hypothetical protein